MSRERWGEIKSVLDQVLDLAPERRSTFLAQRCQDDAELRAQIESYLVLEDEVDEFEQPVFDLVAGRTPEFRSGERLGNYLLERELARGGMGVVYLGRRIDGQYRQSVVIKVMRKGFDTGEFIRWFHNERQILADLEHPNIARLLDGGTTEDGLPYLVMERIEGRRLDQWLSEARPSVNEALAVFLEICDAIHEAHQRLVVHCDLKPSNILVTTDGNPKILDFGIAKILHQDAEGGTRSLALRMGSPRYASPEQLAGEAISTSTDVYSLGRLLFLLLTGTPPRILTDEESVPELPSQAASRGTKPLSAGETADSQRRRRRRLRGDLDAITGMATEWRPTRRYRSAGSLAEDVRRHLDDLPVAAQPFTWHYLLRRFLRRKRQQAIFVTSLVVLAALGLAVSFGFYWQSRIQQSRAVGMRDAYLEMLEVYDPTADESPVDAARSAVTQLLKGEPLRDDQDRALIYDRMGRLFYRLEFLDEAKQLHQHALALYRQAPETNPADLAASLNNLALVSRKLGHREQAAKLYEESLEIHRGLDGDREAEKLDILLNLAAVQTELGQFEAAEDLYRETLERRRALFGTNSMEVARSLNNLGSLLYRVGRLDEAEDMIRRSVELRRQLLGDGHPKLVTAAINLAAVLDAQGATEESIEIYDNVLEQRRSEFGDSHLTTARAKSSLAYALLGRGRPEDLERSRDLLESAAPVFETEYGPGHEDTRIVLRNLAATLLAQGQSARAERLLRGILETADDWRGNGFWRLADVRSLLGEALQQQGETMASEPLLREAWVPIEEQRGPDSRPAREARERWAEYVARTEMN